MYTRAMGPGQTKFIIEEGDPLVLTNLDGTVIVGPHPAPPEGKMVIKYDGSYLSDFCWGVLNPDGALGFQSMTLGSLSRNMVVTLDLDDPGRPSDDHLTPEDRRWLKTITKF